MTFILKTTIAMFAKVLDVLQQMSQLKHESIPDIKFTIVSVYVSNIYCNVALMRWEDLTWPMFVVEQVICIIYF